MRRMDQSLEAQLQATLNMLPAYTWYAAPSGGLAFVNARNPDYGGLLADPPRAAQYLTLVHPEAREAVAQENERMLGGRGGFEFSKQIVRPDGAIREVRCVAGPRARDEVFQGFVGTAVDVTEQEELTK